MRKKVFCMLIVVVLLASSTNVVFAQNNSKILKPNSILLQVDDIKPLNAILYDEETLEMLLLGFNKYGFDIKSIGKNKAGELLVYLQNGVKKSKVTIIQARPEIIEMISTEDKISNRAIIKDNGKIMIDGEYVEFTEAITPDSEVKADAFQDRYQLACPYGTAKDYTNYYRTIRNSNVSFSTGVRNLTTLICALAIGRVIPGFDILFSLSYEIAGLIKKYDPYTSAASFVTVEYFHKKGYFVNNMMAVRKCTSTIYTEANFKGFSFARTFYFVHEFNM